MTNGDILTMEVHNNKTKIEHLIEYSHQSSTFIWKAYYINGHYKFMHYRPLITPNSEIPIDGTSMLILWSNSSFSSEDNIE